MCGSVCGSTRCGLGPHLRTQPLIPWGFLTVGIILGGWWSYEVLGWRLVGLGPGRKRELHAVVDGDRCCSSIMLMRRRGHLKAWTIALVQVLFLLTCWVPS